MADEGVVIVGAGQAGFSTAAKLRSLGYTGALTMIGDETHLPYQRPPLSKAYLLGDMEIDRLSLRPPAFYEDSGIAMVLGEPVLNIDRERRTVQLPGRSIPYAHLVLATGSTPRRLPESIGGNLDGAYTVRGIDDIDAMRPEFAAGRKALIVGGGYIGLEVAAVSAKLGLEVTLIEAAPRILQRVAAPETSDFFRDLHTRRGVRILEGAQLDRLLGEGRVTGARLANGDVIDADFVIFGIGITPNTGLAERAGLKVENGIWTDTFSRTSDLAIWAAGDCASFPFGDRRIRLESVGNAIDQGEIVAANILGADRAYAARPWFWSDQYDVKLQIAGLNAGYDSVVVRNASETARSHWYYAGDRLLAVDAMNDPRGYMIAKRLIDEGRSPAKALVADPDGDLMGFLKSAAA